MIFRDRQDAGKKLGETLQLKNYQNPYVFAIPRGGVPVALSVGKKLGVEIDFLPVRQLTFKENPNHSFGAVGPHNTIVLDETILRTVGITPEELNDVKKQEHAEVLRRAVLYRGNNNFPDLTNKTAILVDDGISTTDIFRAAIKYVKTLNPAKVVVAVAVSAKDITEPLRRDLDDLIVLNEHTRFDPTSEWFAHFELVTDEQIIELIERYQKPMHIGFLGGELTR